MTHNIACTTRKIKLSLQSIISLSLKTLFEHKNTFRIWSFMKSGIILPLYYFDKNPPCTVCCLTLEIRQLRPPFSGLLQLPEQMEGLFFWRLSNSTTLQKNHYAYNLVSLQLYNTTEKKYGLVNFLDLQPDFLNWWCVILCRVVELESIGDSPTLQLYKICPMPITWWISNSTTLQKKNPV